jgi:hypothetical protein
LYQRQTINPVTQADNGKLMRIKVFTSRLQQPLWHTTPGLCKKPSVGAATVEFKFAYDIVPEALANDAENWASFRVQDPEAPANA